MSVWRDRIHAGRALRKNVEEAVCLFVYFSILYFVCRFHAIPFSVFILDKLTQLGWYICADICGFSQLQRALEG